MTDMVAFERAQERRLRLYRISWFLIWSMWAMLIAMVVLVWWGW